MFTDFFYVLRKRKVPVSITEWMTLMEALAKGYITTLDEFYFLARAILVKSEAYFDHYDVAFQEYFKGIETPAEITEQILEWLRDPLNRITLTEEERVLFDNMDFDELLSELEKRLKEQTEQHDGGHYWIGRGGTSP
ncbi:MAG: VWA containing CoxE family protein, partial [Dehalococcoidia bacterium]